MQHLYGYKGALIMIIHVQVKLNLVIYVLQINNDFTTLDVISVFVIG